MKLTTLAVLSWVTSLVQGQDYSYGNDGSMQEENHVFDKSGDASRELLDLIDSPSSPSGDGGCPGISPVSPFSFKLNNAPQRHFLVRPINHEMLY
jgi:hypothetical protein